MLISGGSQWPQQLVGLEKWPNISGQKLSGNDEWPNRRFETTNIPYCMRKHCPTQYTIAICMNDIETCLAYNAMLCLNTMQPMGQKKVRFLHSQTCREKEKVSSFQGCSQREVPMYYTTVRCQPKPPQLGPFERSHQLLYRLDISTPTLSYLRGVCANGVPISWWCEDPNQSRLPRTSIVVVTHPPSLVHT